MRSHAKREGAQGVMGKRKDGRRSPFRFPVSRDPALENLPCNPRRVCRAKYANQAHNKLAQLVQRLTAGRKVLGSIPWTGPTLRVSE